MGFMSATRAMLAGSILIGSMTAASAETTLNFSNYIPAGHFFNQRIMNVWADNVEEATEGRVKINVLPKFVGGVTAQYDVAVDGLADIVLFNPGYSPGRFDLSGIGEAPLFSENPNAAGIAFWRFYEAELKPLGLFKEVHMLGAFTASPGNLITRDAPPTSFEGLKNLKIRSPLPINKILIEHAGGVPIAKSITEAYELMSTGVIDGSFAGFDTIEGFKLNEVSQGAIEVPGGLYNATVGIAMNQQKWDSISPEDQAAINSVSGEAMARLVGEVYETALEEGKQLLIDSGVELYVADEAFIASVREASQPVYEALIAAAAEAGAEDPENILVRFQDTIKAVEEELAAAE